MDFDNVEAGLKAAGPVGLARLLVTLVPEAVLARHDAALVRLYGGWRAQGNLTNLAQRLVPDIRSSSPTVVPVRHTGQRHQLRLTVELADCPIGTTAPLQEMLVKDRDLRKFRTRPSGWAQCAAPSTCGFGNVAGLTHATPCGNLGCASRLGDVLVRDEQKMVDTLIVADLAFQALSARATDVVVVSSDTDMWPGVLLALRSGCAVTHIHTRPGWRTQRHLLTTLGAQAARSYQQLSV